MKFSIQNAKILYDAVSKCQKICAKESTRYALEMIELVVKEETLVITALDGIKAIQKHVPAICEEPGACVVDPQLLLDIIGKERAPVFFRTENESLVCTRANATATIQLCTDPYIDYQNFWTSPEQTYDICFNLDYLIDVTKNLKESSEENVVHMQFDATSNNKAALLSLLHSGSRALILPVRYFGKKESKTL